MEAYIIRNICYLVSASVFQSLVTALVLCRLDYGGCGTGVEQSASTDQGRLVAVVFLTADKGPYVSAVVQLTFDYTCYFLPSFFFKI